jgi:enolase-phosphatase E1
LETYPKIAEAVNVSAESILFLSDIVEELEAAKAAGFQTVQLVRPGTAATWEKCVNDFTEIEL